MSDVYDCLIDSGEPLVKDKREKCDLVYKNMGNNMVSLLRCIPHEGQLLYEVSGTLHKSKPNTTQRFLAESEREAKERYLYLYGWKATSCRYIPPGDEAESILSDPSKMPL